MACGDKYRSLLKSTSGRTPESPCRIYCNAPDAESWRAAAVAMRSKVQAQWAQLAAVQGGGGADLLAELEAYGEEVDELPEVPTFALPETWSSQIGMFIASMERGVCLLERIDDAFAATGREPPKVPGTTPRQPSDLLQSVGGLVLLGGAGFLLWKIFGAKGAS